MPAGYGAGSASTASPIVAVAIGVDLPPVHAHGDAGDGQGRVGRAGARNVPVPSTVASETKRTPRSLIVVARGGERAAAQPGSALRAL